MMQGQHNGLWDKRFNKFLLHMNSTRSDVVPKSDNKLYKWVDNQRTQVKAWYGGKRCQLTMDKIEKN